MADKASEKTNVMRLLDQKKITYVTHQLEDAEGLTGVQIAYRLGLDPACGFKTLVTVSASKRNYVFIVPVAMELDLKKAARNTHEKWIEMIPQKELLSLTGYVHGGCSPIGMKKRFPIYIHENAATFPAIRISGGKVGVQVELSLQDLKKMVPVTEADIASFSAP